MDGAEVAVLSNQIFAAQSEAHQQRYFDLLEQRARGEITFEGEQELYTLSPLTLLARELDVDRSELRQLMEQRRGYDYRMEGTKLNYDNPAEFAARQDALDEKYGIDPADYSTYITTLNEITATYPDTPLYKRMITEEELTRQLYQGIADGRVNLELLNPDHAQNVRLGVDADPEYLNQPLFSLFADMSPAQQWRIAEFLEQDPLSLNDLLEGYGHDLESGVWFLNAGDEGLDESEVWGWFREHYTDQ